jgi:Amt family ammonium transporter
MLWSILVYAPLAHWVWAPGGWLRTLGALDFAGGTVVHISSGVSALVVALLVGRRFTNGHAHEPHDIRLTVLGAGLLWFGWFGFNAGSALAATGQAANALLVTNTAAAAGTLSWVLVSYLHKSKVSAIGAACGAVAGLVAITPASGFVTAGGAVFIGLAAGGVCYGATLLRERLRVDDALDVFAVHGVGGILGAVGTGVFATAAIGGASGAIEGNVGQIGIQLIAVAATVAFASVATFLIVKVTGLVLGLRVDPSIEEMGLDLGLHGEAASNA